MKVFKMNEYDWVAANTVAEAVEWYLKNTGYDWVEDGLEINPVECNLDASIKLNGYDEDFISYQKIDSEKPDVVWTTFRDILEYDKRKLSWFGKEPYVILSTEY